MTTVVDDHATVTPQAALFAAWQECAFHEVLPSPYTYLSWCVIAEDNRPDAVLSLLLQAETDASLHPAIKRAWNRSFKTEAAPTKEQPKVEDEANSPSWRERIDSARDWLGTKIGSDEPLIGKKTTSGS